MSVIESQKVRTGKDLSGHLAWHLTLAGKETDIHRTQEEIYAKVGI